MSSWSGNKKEGVRPPSTASPGVDLRTPQASKFQTESFPLPFPPYDQQGAWSETRNGNSQAAYQSDKFREGNILPGSFNGAIPDQSFTDEAATLSKALDSRTIVGSTSSRQVIGTISDRHLLDKSYKVRNFDWQKFFRPGRVFSTLWTDAFAGTAGDGDNQQFSSAVSYVIYKEKVHSKIRRFVVVRLGDRCCQCLPVTTYDGRGARKKGINLNEHGLIFSSEEKPSSVKGVEKLPLRVHLSKGSERLTNPSFINYGRVYTVETNVKVKDVGELDSESRKHLRIYYNQVNSLVFEDIDEPSPAMSTLSRLYTTNWQPLLSPGWHPKESLGVGHEKPSGLSSSRDADYENHYEVESHDHRGRMSPQRSSSITPPNDNLDPNVAPDHQANMFRSSKGKSITRDSSLQSRSSSVLSSRSFASSLSSMTAASIEELIKGRERLIQFLIQNDELKCLYDCARENVSLAEFADFFRLFLIEFARALRIESSSSHNSTLFRQAARAIKRSSRIAADAVSQTIWSQQEAQVNVSVSNHLHEISGYDGPEAGESDSENEKDSDDIKFDVLEESLICSTAFLALKGNLKALANKSPVQKALFSVWPLELDWTSLFQIDYNMEWNILQVGRQHFSANQKLGDVMTLTGGIHDAQAMSCKDYLLLTWPLYSSLLTDVLLAIESLISGTKYVILRHGKVRIELKSLETTEHVDQTLSLTDGHLSISATHEIHAVLISALSWLCAAIRFSPFLGPVQSSVSVQRSTTGDGTSIDISLTQLVETPSAKACWHSLFPHAVIATGFPIKERHEGKGLEISFSDMAMMSRSTSFIEYGEGLLGQGLRSLLIPVKELVDDDAFQWHYAIKKQKRSRKEGRMEAILRENDIIGWHKETRCCRLIERRCFLGWAEKIHVIAGTESYLDGEIRWSGIEKEPTPISVKSHNISLDHEGLTYHGEEGERLWMPTAVCSSIILPVNKDISDCLDDEQDTDVLIYDTGSKTATFLPHAIVTLLLVRRIIERRQYQLFDGRISVPLPFVQPSANGSQEAIITLMESLSLQIRKSHAKKCTPLDDFSFLVRQVLEMIETVRSGMEDVENRFARIGAGLSTKGLLQGVDFIDMVKMSRRLRIREVEIDQAWTDLGGHHSTVLFCKGFGQPIVCAEPEKQCNPWRHIPTGKDYLVMTGQSILHLLEQYEDDDGNSRLGQSLEWKFPEDINHTHHLATSGVFHIQDIKTVSHAKFQTRIRERLLPLRESGFIFSDAKSPLKLCYELPAGIVSASILQAGIMQSTAQQPCLEPFDSASNTSLESYERSIGDQIAADSMSSDETQDQEREKGPSCIARIKPETGIVLGNTFEEFKACAEVNEVQTETLQEPTDNKSKKGKKKWNVFKSWAREAMAHD